MPDTSDAYSEGREGPGQETDAAGTARSFDWLEYGPSIRRWEALIGRTAPDPTEIGPKGNVRLSPAFVEWMMGYPEGWVTDFGFARKHTFRLLGNGVVPQQAALAIRGLIDEASGFHAGRSALRTSDLGIAA